MKLNYFLRDLYQVRELNSKIKKYILIRSTFDLRSRGKCGEDTLNLYQYWKLGWGGKWKTKVNLLSTKEIPQGIKSILSIYLMKILILLTITRIMFRNLTFFLFYRRRLYFYFKWYPLLIQKLVYINRSATVSNIY